MASLNKETMKMMIVSSTSVKPTYDCSPPPSTTAHIPLTAFDKLAYDGQEGIIYAYRPPAVPTATLKQGLQKVLSVYREYAGRFGKNQKGEDVILLNDRGVRFVEASVDIRLDQSMASLLKPSRALLSLHPPMKGVDELLQVQITRFACGSMVIGLTAHHKVADGHSAGNFLVAWGRACRGLDIGPLPLHDRSSIFTLLNPPQNNEFDHHWMEYTSKRTLDLKGEAGLLDDIVMHKVHFSAGFMRTLKARASQSSKSSEPDIGNYNDKRPTYSTFECLSAHLWRAITRARSLNAHETTQMRIAVNGRSRMNPMVSNEYLGNLVLWATPKAMVKDLLAQPIFHVAKLIHEEIAKVDERYFRSFINFTESTKFKDDPDTILISAVGNPVICPDVSVNSWLRLPLNDLDFGCGSPYMLMPTYYPIEGLIYILPSYVEDGSIDVFINLFTGQLDPFTQNCNVLD
ncbi:hypothetical protein SAY86_018734 [Trapa natans]|uniref:Uncharacterized protein n=1 Tax=Trapa natans TaxID=22666 RepID=A0AAN7R206_TRANT|nr:hypothetical protein SAY86_018734 [Trapa natans]